jgi:Site-specific DNA methylase
MNTNKSPLRYPGGKARAAITLVNLFPKKISKLLSPFFGGGSVEIEAASRGVKVYGADLFSPVAFFWQQILKNPNDLVTGAKKYLSMMSREMFYNLQHELRDLLDNEGFHLKNKRDISKAALLFFVLNRSSFSGATLSGGMSPGHARFTPSAIERVKNFKQPNLIQVENTPWTETLKVTDKDMFVYLDPPYLIDSFLYGDSGSTHKGFDHIGLNKRLEELDAQGIRWMLSYNNCNEIVNLYSKYKKMFPKWKYGMSNDKDSKEILILNY